jgi:hypothetical protein
MIDMSGAAVASRTKRCSMLSDLDPARRLHGKIGMRPQDVSARLRTVSELRKLCLRLGEIGRKARERGELK